MKSNITWIAGGTVVVAVGIGAAAFTANNTIPDTNAGQGVSTTSGFAVTNVEYSTDVAEGANTPEDVKATAINFNIARLGSQSGTAVADANAKVFAQLRSSVADADWAQCTTTAGAATCTLTGDEQMILNAISELSVAAFDNTP